MTYPVYPVTEATIFREGENLLNPGQNSLVTAMTIQMRTEITLYEVGRMRGLLYSQYLDEPYEFFSFIRMIEKMEEIFDSKKFPQAFMTPRTFNIAKKGTKKLNAERNDTMKEAMKPNSKKDDSQAQCTFEINVKFRQNATWQGQILWAEKNQKQNFRSVLEMLKLMDEALTESGGDEAAVDWGGGK